MLGFAAAPVLRSHREALAMLGFAAAPVLRSHREAVPSERFVAAPVLWSHGEAPATPGFAAVVRQDYQRDRANPGARPQICAVGAISERTAFIEEPGRC